MQLRLLLRKPIDNFDHDLIVVDHLDNTRYHRSSGGDGRVCLIRRGVYVAVGELNCFRNGHLPILHQKLSEVLVFELSVDVLLFCVK